MKVNIDSKRATKEEEAGETIQQINSISQQKLISQSLVEVKSDLIKISLIQ